MNSNRILGYLISIPVLLLGALGNYHIYSLPSEDLTSPRNLVVAILTVLVEVAVLLLIHAAAKSTGSAPHKWVNRVTFALLGIMVPVSLLGQYGTLGKAAFTHKAEAEAASATVADTSSERASLEAEKAAVIEASKVERASLEAEKAVALAALVSERKSGEGPRAASKKADLDAVTARIESLSNSNRVAEISARIASLAEVKTQAQVRAVDKTELILLADEFGVNPDSAVKIMIGVFISIANLVGFWLVFLGDLHAVAAATLTPAPKKKKARVRRKAVKTIVEAAQSISREPFRAARYFGTDSPVEILNRLS